MAQVTTANAIGQKEDLSDVIYRIDPDTTPLVSNLRKVTKNAINFDWQVQELSAAASSPAVEGATVSSFTDTPTTRHQNTMQIALRAYSVSDTMDAIDAAGRERESNYNKLLRGIEARRDVEFTLLTDQAEVASGTRKTGALPSWISNYDTGASPTLNAGFTADGDNLPITDAATDAGSDGIADDWGTPRAFAISQLNTVLQACREDGGQPNLLVMSPKQKVAFSAAAISAQGTSVLNNEVQMREAGDASMTGSVTVFVSDFGSLTTTVDTFCPSERIYAIDTDYAELATLPGRNFAAQDLAKEGDSTRGFVVCEFGLVNNAPKAHGAVYCLS